MAKYEYSEYKIIIDPESKKVQGLRVGDVVRRQYFDAPNLIYSLMVVLDTGVDAINGKESHYFVGALLEGDEPKTGELLDFVRVTSLRDKERGGALYLTASDSESPFLDVIDGLGFENSLLYQPKAQKFSGEQKYLLNGDVGYPEMLLVAYRVRASESTTVTVSVGYSDEIDGIDEVEVSTEWQYKLSAIVIDYPEQYQRELAITTDAEWCEIEQLNVVRLSDVATFAKATKARIGKITGIVDPIFGKLEGYGAYFQNLYATRNVNIAGTLTAGDENGFASTFYVGKIHKNTIINSLDCNFSNSTIVTESSPVGIGKVRQVTNDTTLTAQTSDWRDERIGKLYTFSIWVKGAEQSITLYQDEHRIGSIISQSKDWHRHKITFEVQSSNNSQMTLRIEGVSENTLVTAPQLEAGEYISQYQPTDSTLNETEDYGAWFTKGGIGGTIQNPLLRLNEDGSISSIDNSFVINRDGSGLFAGGALRWNENSLQFSDSVVLGWENLSEQVKENIRTEVSDGLPQWVNEWDSGKTQIGASYVITPKIFAGTKNEDETITGVAMGQFDLATKQADGTIKTETIDGIYGFREGVRTFAVLNSGSVELGNGDNFIRYNAENGRIEFGSAVAMQWVGATYIDASGIFTGRLSAQTISAVNLSATQITSGYISADRIAASSIKAEKLDAKSIKAELITADYVSGLECKFVKGTIGGWGIKFGMLSADNIAIDSLNRKISVYDSLSTPSLGRRVQLFYATDNNFGILATDNSGESLFRLGSNNHIAGWKITKDTISKNAVSLSADGSIYNTFRWKLNNDGSGLLANGNISWDSTGNVTFAPSVALNWTAPILEITPKLTRITAEGIYTGTITAEQINAGVINAALIDVAALKTSLITAENINALSLTTEKGSIGGWSITAYSISKNNVILSHDGTIYNGAKWKLNNDGSGQLADGNISWNAEGNITFAPSVALNWAAPIAEISPKVTQLTSEGIYTGTLTAKQVNAVEINAESITAGKIDAQRIGVGSIKADKLDADSIKSSIINANYISGLSCNFTSGRIAGWKIEEFCLSSSNMQIDGRSRSIVMHSSEATPTAGSRVQLYYTSDTNYGLRVFDSENKHIAKFGSSNMIGGWIISEDSIFKNGVYLTANGSVSNDGKWRLDSKGHGYLAGGKIRWDNDGNVFFASSVAAQWESKIIEGELYARSTWGDGATYKKFVSLNGKTIMQNSHNGFTVAIIDRRTLVHTGNHNFDTMNSEYQAERMADVLNSTSANYIVVVATYGYYKITERLSLALQWCGSHAYDETLNAPYLLVGIPGIGKGNGIVSVGNSNIAEVATSIKNGVPMGVNGGGNITTHITGNGIYTGTLSANQINAGVLNAKYIDVDSLKSKLITAESINAIALTTTKGTIGGWNINSYQISKNSVALSSDGSIVNGSKWRLNNDGSGQLANGNISWDTQGGITAKNALFTNVRLQGSVRNPFVLNDSSIWIGSDAPSDQENFNNFDNIVAIRGSWNEHISLPWGLEQSGRRITLVNYKWQSNETIGYMDISAPSGKYFYEDGIAKTQISFSREFMELLGYGDDRTFFGWIVLNRINLMTTYRYGKGLKLLAQGRVTGTNTTAYFSKIKTFDNSTLTIQRLGVGVYQINLPPAWFSSAEDIMFMATGYGSSYGAATLPIKATIWARTTTYIQVALSDDASANDGSFYFQISNMNDWTY